MHIVKTVMAVSVLVLVALAPTSAVAFGQLTSSNNPCQLPGSQEPDWCTVNVSWQKAPSDFAYCLWQKEPFFSLLDCQGYASHTSSLEYVRQEGIQVELRNHDYFPTNDPNWRENLTEHYYEGEYLDELFVDALTHPNGSVNFEATNPCTPACNAQIEWQANQYSSLWVVDADNTSNRSRIGLGSGVLSKTWSPSATARYRFEVHSGSGYGNHIASTVVWEINSSPVSGNLISLSPTSCSISGSNLCTTGVYWTASDLNTIVVVNAAGNVIYRLLNVAGTYNHQISFINAGEYSFHLYGGLYFHYGDELPSTAPLDTLGPFTVTDPSQGSITNVVPDSCTLPIGGNCTTTVYWNADGNNTIYLLDSSGGTVDYYQSNGGSYLSRNFSSSLADDYMFSLYEGHHGSSPPANPPLDSAPWEVLPPSGPGETIEYYHVDALGSIVAATNEQGAVLWRESYDPYGGRIRYEDNGENALWYTGKELDENTGLAYYGARFYDPLIGQFMQVDPAAVNPDDSLTFNRFAYGKNNPYRYIDPDGEVAFIPLIIWGVGSAITAYDTYKTYQEEGAGAAAQSLAVDAAITIVSGGTAKVALKVADRYSDATRAAENLVDGAVTKDATELRRPYLRKSTREAIQDAAQKTPDGKFIDPNTGKVIDGKSHYGHKYGHEHRRLKAEAEAKGMTQKEFNDHINNNPQFFQIEDPASNMSHIFEKPGG